MFSTLENHTKAPEMLSTLLKTNSFPQHCCSRDTVLQISNMSRGRTAAAHCIVQNDEILSRDSIIDEEHMDYPIIIIIINIFSYKVSWK